MKKILPCLVVLFFLGYSEVVHAQEKDTLDVDLKKIARDEYNGAAYTIWMDDLKNLPVTNLTNLLGGLVPGFFSYQTSGGTVDEGADYWLRGIRTTAEGVLVLVDGQERTFGTLSSQEVESITVMKDALASVLYGMRAANGAIMVKTRKGVKGKPVIELTAQAINQKPLNLLKPLGGLQYAERYNEALRNDGLSTGNMYSNDYLEHYRNRTGVNEEYYPDVNWMDDYFKKSSWVQRYNLNISGGSDRTRYFINGGYLYQNGMFKTDEDASYSTNNNTARFNLRSNLEVDVTKTTLLNIDLYGWSDRQNRPGGSSYEAYDALITTPANFFPPYYMDNGNYVDQDGNSVTGIGGKITAGNGLAPNPWALLNRNGYSILNRVYGSFRTKLTQELPFITKGLRASALLSMDTYTNAITNRQKGYAYYQFNNINDRTVLRKTGEDVKMSNGVTGKTSETRSLLEVQLAYDKSIQKHNISALAFYNQYEFTNQTSIPSRFQTIGSWLSYNYDKRYSLDLTGSYQGVYKFAPGKRFGFFPAVAAGWTISNENFFEGIRDHISYFKLRGSYGIVGNQRGVSEFYYMGRMETTAGIYNFGNNMGGVGGYVESVIANPNLTWEQAEQLNLGTDIRLFKDQFRFGFDYFKDNRYDMFMVNRNISSLLGLGVRGNGNQVLIEENIGEMNSSGYEMAASWNSTVGDISYHVGGTYSAFKNKVVKTGQVTQPYPWLMEQDYPLNIRTGYVALGLFQSYEEIAAAPTQTFSQVQPGDIRYKDINGDGIINNFDQVPLDFSSVPRVFYGFNAGLSYKKLGFNIYFQGAAKTTRMLGGKVAHPFISRGNMYEHQEDYWTPENTDASLPRLSTITSNSNNTVSSSFWLRDGSYLRLKAVELYYELPKSLIGGSFIKNMRLFANGYNLHVWSKADSPLDPEDSGASNSMPLTRNTSIGCSITF